MIKLSGHWEITELSAVFVSESDTKVFTIVDQELIERLRIEQQKDEVIVNYLEETLEILEEMTIG